MRIAVWLKILDLLGSVELRLVSIRRADRCLVEEPDLDVTKREPSLFQSAVRIAVWLKIFDEHGRQSQHSFNPPCGSLFG